MAIDNVGNQPTVRDGRFVADPADPFGPETETQHAGKVFVVPQHVLIGAGIRSSDGTDPVVIGDRLLLCLWDAQDGTSIWLGLQSSGDFEIPFESKLLRAGTDPNWMNPARITRYRDGTLWLLGRPGAPFRYRQAQQRAITRDELTVVRGRMSPTSVDALVPPVS